MYRIRASQKLCFFVPILTYRDALERILANIFSKGLTFVQYFFLCIRPSEGPLDSKSFYTSTSIRKRSSLRITSCEGKDGAAAWTPWCWLWPRECQETRPGYIGSSPWKRLNGRRLGVKMMLCRHVHVMLSCYLECFYLLQFQRPSWDPWAAFNLPVSKRRPKGLRKRGQAADATSSLSLSERILVSSPQSAKMKTKDGQIDFDKSWQMYANVCKCWMSSGPELKEVIGSVIRFLLSTVSGRNNEIPNFYSGSLSTQPSLGLTCVSRIVFPASLHNLSSDKSTNPTCWERCYYRGVPRWFILQMQGTCSTSNAKWIHFSKPTYMYNISQVSTYTSNLNIWLHVTVTCWKILVASKFTNCPISLTTTQFDGIPLVSKSLAILPYPSGRIKDTKGAAKCVLHLWTVLQVWSQNLSPALASLI